MNTLLSHFHSTNVEQPCTHGKSQDDEGKASSREVNCGDHMQRQVCAA